MLKTYTERANDPKRYCVIASPFGGFVAYDQFLCKSMKRFKTEEAAQLYFKSSEFVSKENK